MDIQAPVDFVIVTPLDEERDAVLSKGEFKQLDPTHDDVRVYHATELPVTFPSGKTATYRVILVSLLGMGRVQAAIATSDAIDRWDPRYVLLVGIAGGLREAGVGLGDVLIADKVADYEEQKLKENKPPEIRWQVHPTDPQLLGAARNLKRDAWKDLIAVKRPEEGEPEWHVGPITTGDKVVADGSLADRYGDTWAKLIGVEMEAGGTASAAFQAAQKPGFFMVRGVSDLADPDKNSPRVEGWRAYARDVAAAYAIGLLRSGPVPAGQRDSDEKSSSVPSPTASAQENQGAIDIWRMRLKHFREELARTTDPGKEFTIKLEIEEAERKIRELGG